MLKKYLNFIRNNEEALTLLTKKINKMSICELIKAILARMTDQSDSELKTQIIVRAIESKNNDDYEFWGNLSDLLIDFIANNNDNLLLTINSPIIFGSIYGLVVNHRANDTIMKEALKILIKIQEVIEKDLITQDEATHSNDFKLNEQHDNKFEHYRNGIDNLFDCLYKTIKVFIEEFSVEKDNSGFMQTTFGQIIQTLGLKK